MDLPKLQKELRTAQQHVLDLSSQVEEAMRDQLLTLPAREGFANIDELIKALKKVAKSATRGRYKKSIAGSDEDTASEPKKRRRVRITPRKKAKLQQLVAEGKTGGEIAKALNISLASVHNVKRELGLIKKSA